MSNAITVRTKSIRIKSLLFTTIITARKAAKAAKQATKKAHCAAKSISSETKSTVKAAWNADLD